MRLDQILLASNNRLYRKTIAFGGPEANFPSVACTAEEFLHPIPTLFHRDLEEFVRSQNERRQKTQRVKNRTRSRQNTSSRRRTTFWAYAKAKRVRSHTPLNSQSLLYMGSSLSVAMLLYSFNLSESGMASLTMGLLLIHLVSLKSPLHNRLRKLLTCAIAFGSDGRDFRQSST